jgi:hypothetical protein
MVDALQTQRGERGKKTSLLPRLSIIHSMVKGKPQQYGAYPTAPVTLTDSRVIGHADTSMIKAKKNEFNNQNGYENIQKNQKGKR